jgi:hypothetical protein
VWGVLTAAITELLELEAACGRLLVLRRRVVALFALSALQCNNFPHLFILPDFPLFPVFLLASGGPEGPQGLKPLVFLVLRHD